MRHISDNAIRLVTVEAGPEIVARFIAQGMSARLGQPVVVDVQPNGTTPIELAAQAPADGRTLLVFAQTLWTFPLMQTTRYDPVKDFLPVTLATTSPSVVVVHPSVAANSIADLIALAKARPGQLSYASGLNGSTSQFAGALLAHMAGIDIARVTYKGGGLVALEDVIAGKAQLMFPSANAGMAAVNAGKLRALAVASADPSALVPGLPTVAATLPGYEAAQTIGVFAPANTPLPVIERLNREIVQFVKTDETRQQLINAGLEAVGSKPKELAAKMKSEIATWRKIISDIGIRAN